MNIPAPAHHMFGAIGCNFKQFLSATIVPEVARVSAAKMTPSLNLTPTIVVPVLVKPGGFMPVFSSAMFRLVKEKSNPPLL